MDIYSKEGNFYFKLSVASIILLTLILSFISVDKIITVEITSNKNALTTTEYVAICMHESRGYKKRREIYQSLQNTKPNSPAIIICADGKELNFKKIIIESSRFVLIKNISMLEKIYAAAI